MKYLFSFIIICHLFNFINAQEQEMAALSPPGSEIVLADIKFKKGQVFINNAQNITSRTGYDSQPVFMNKDKSLFFTRYINNQTDIYTIDLKKRIARPYMKTPESEYSATPIAGREGISVVRVELEKNEQGKDAQHVRWQYKRKKRNNSDLMSDLDNIGYHNWTGKNKLWMFIINEQQGDLYYQTTGKQPRKMASNIGRSIKTDAKYKYVYYVDKSQDDWWITKIDTKKFKKKKVIKLPKDVEDFAIDSKGNFWCGQSNTLYYSKKGKSWTMVKEFDIPGLSNISRIDVNKRVSQIALVFDEE